ncbi:cytochrome d ubiquinol oxidase subunit II [Bacillus dakarensis]|uniref:cytochrome d ubiquinol oxidase subunit II n=1 Tax=Robertmurraya dakarensis TaxID=1926278 RepID=UPI0009813E19|nr:cytochrome d ubiquinol oxidase subunit II [Bacillus dakarensis]
MILEIVGISILWLFLFGYIMVASIDFGAGFFNAFSLFRGKHHILTKIIGRYLSPVWEVTNVFLVFFFVGIVGFFPETAFYYGTTLLIPASIAIILLASRGAYYAFASTGEIKQKRYIYSYGISGLFIPASLSVVLTISEGGFVQVEGTSPVLDYWGLITNPLTWGFVSLSLSVVLFSSALFLTWYAHKANDIKASELLRKYALIWSVSMILSALCTFSLLRFHNPGHYERLTELSWMFIPSLLLFFGTFYLIWSKRNYGLAFGLLALQIALAFFAYGISHLPYLLYPYLTIYDGFADEAMAVMMIIAFIAGLVLLFPSLFLLLRLFLFNKEYVQSNHIDP